MNKHDPSSQVTVFFGALSAIGLGAAIFSLPSTNTSPQEADGSYLFRAHAKSK